MASPFSITTATNTVILNDKRQGQATFTVTNLMGRLLRGRAQLVSQDPAAAKWLSIAGAAERDFAIAGTEQYAVEIAVPATAAAGSYSFHLDMVGVENPDELFTKGPTVAFAVPVTPPPRKPFPWWIVVAGAAVVLLLVVGIIVFMITRPAPSFAGRWNLSDSGTADLTQTGNHVSGTIRPRVGFELSTVDGTVNGSTLQGNVAYFGAGILPFTWVIDSDGRTFRGNLNFFQPFCGWRDGAGPPSSCHN